MLIRAYLPKILAALFGGLFVALGIITFGNSELFDRIFFGVLIFTAILCRKNVNVVGVVIIIVIHQFLAETAWLIIQKEYLVKPILIELTFYTISIFACYKFRHDSMSKLLLATLIISIASEIYWFWHDSDGAAMHWYVMVLTINLLTRYLIFLRVSYTLNYFPQKTESINLDWYIYKLNALAIFIQTANIAEYSLRRVLGATDFLYVYVMYPYVMQAISTYTIFIIFNESYKLIIPKLLRA